MKRLIPATAAAFAAVLMAQGQAAAVTPELELDYQSAVEAVDNFWAREFDAAGLKYAAPENLGIVESPVETACGPAAVDNGGYCMVDNTLYFGAEYINEGASVGDAFVYDLVAHEWAHAVQEQLPAGTVPLQVELQADCMSGATLTALVDEGVLIVEDGDMEEIEQKLRDDGDNKPWATISDHGNADQRVAAFTIGWDGGIEACLAGEDGNPMAVFEP